MMGNYPTFLVREPDAGNPHVRFDEREVETEPQATAPPLDSSGQDDRGAECAIETRSVSEANFFSRPRLRFGLRCAHE
jgi:hypothetical protein